MAARPTVPDWNTPNSDKPEEYSSEFVQDGKRYAVVVNVATGQRQLYSVNPLTRERSLLQSTNADGTIVPPNEQTQRNLDEFKRDFGGNEALQKALDTTRKQAFFIIEKASTPEEKEQLSKTKEYEGFKYSKEDPSVGASTVASFDVVPSKNSPFPKGSPPGHYPIDIRETDQDRIKFQAVQLSGRNRAFNPTDYKSVAGPVFISMQGPIVDQNLVKWGESRVNGGEGVAASIGLDLMGKDGSGLTDAGKKAQELLPNIPEATAALAAGNMDIFTRLTQNVFNPNLELIFKEPQLRPFNFNFKMSARGADEAEEIKKIIRYFKYHMAPKGKGGDLFLKAPDVFWIEYQKGKSAINEKGKLHPSLNLIAPEDAKKKACALMNMSVNYTPLGTYMTYDDEEATIVQYDILLGFREITPVYQVDYEEEPGKDHSIGY